MDLPPIPIFFSRDDDANPHSQTGTSSTGEKVPAAWLPSQVASYLYQRMQAHEFYVLCPDNSVSEGMDRKRILWTAGDLVHRRPPLSRWRDGWKERAEEWMRNCEVPE